MKYTNQELVAAANLYPATWVLQNEIKNEMGFPIEFEKRPFLWDIYNDLSPLQAWLKPPQIGATVCQTIKSFYVAKNLKRQIIYTLPTLSDVQEMVGGSINRIINQNPILMDWVKDHDTVEQKQVGDSMIFYRGTFTSKQAMMIPSGLNIHDEVDASDSTVITQYQTRLQAQEDGGWSWYFSHPSLAGMGIDNYWQQSDKKEWFITCPRCKKEFIMEWPRNLDRVKGYICHECGEVLPDASRIKGKWKKTAEGVYSGWHVSQLMLYNKSAKDIFAAFDDPLKDKQYFYNYVLGLPYAGGDDKIEAQTVLKNCVPEVNEQEGRIIIGVDTGLPIHFTILNQEGVFYYGTCEPETEKEKSDPNYDPYDKLESFLRRWKNAILVSDQGGDLIGIRKLQAKYSGRVFLCYYRKDRKTNDFIKWGEGKEHGTVTVDRNRQIQIIVEQLKDTGRIRLNGTTEEWREWANHFGNIYREKVVVKEAKEKDDKSLYGTEFVWKRRGADHYVHTLLYALVGLDKFGKMLATIVGQDPLESIERAQMIQDNGIMLSDSFL